MTDKPQTSPGTSTAAGAENKRIELSADQAVQVVQPAAAAVKQSWLTAAVGLANAIRSGKLVSSGAFEDVKHLREQFEELERARIMLQGASAAGKAPPKADA